jgi:hypothetical protein
MMAQRVKPYRPAKNETSVDIDALAQAYVSGRNAEKLQLDGVNMPTIIDLFIGCVQEIYPETQNFETTRYIKDAYLRAEGRDGHEQDGS